MYRKSILISALTLLTLTGCGTTPPINAQDKTVSHNGEIYVFGGQFDENKGEVKLTVNGDTLMKGRFPPFTPTLNLASDYEDINISSYCYFGSVLGGKGGVFGAVAGVIQSSNSKSADKCEIKIAGEIVESLYF